MVRVTRAADGSLLSVRPRYGVREKHQSATWQQYPFRLAVQWPSVEDMVRQRGWLVLYWVLLVAFLGTAALNMLHVRGGFLTDHAADLVVPAWLYVTARGLYSVHDRRTLLQRTLGRTPERAATSLFLASTATEISQLPWPRGIFSGRFDSLDIVAYAAGLAACYIADTRSPVGAERVAIGNRDIAA